MQKCRICGCTEFFKEAGYYFCQTCQTQNEDIREEVLDIRVDPTTKLRKTRIRQLKSDKSGEELGWTSWELYNFALIGLTNELIELGAPVEIKLTILQLWSTYLKKLEVAFTSTKQKAVPKLALKYHKKDAYIIYGKVKSQKRSRKRRKTGSNASTSMASSYHSEESSIREINKNKKLMINAEYDRYMQSQASSEGDALSSFNQSMCSGLSGGSGISSDNEQKLKFNSQAKKEMNKIKKLSKNLAKSKRTKYRAKHVTSQYKAGPNIITPMKLWAILYLALRIHNQPLQLGDMLRYRREGHLSYHRLEHLLPPEVVITKTEATLLTHTQEITHKGMRKIITRMAKLLQVTKIAFPDFAALVSRYCEELGLPRDIQIYAERLYCLCSPFKPYNPEKHYIPNYEGRAMAFIILVLKVLFALDGVTEHEISRVAETINRVEQQRLREDECKCFVKNCIPSIIVHGGAGNFSDDLIMEKITACKKAAINGFRKLMNGGSSAEAVEAAIWWLECDEFFNCSYGSVLNELGEVQMDASMMDGSTMNCGSVAAISDIEHPISVAKYIMENFPNSIFVGEGAKNLAKLADFNLISEGNMIAPPAYLAFKLEDTGDIEVLQDSENLQCAGLSANSSGTVGCVAYDGNSIAAGTSTGGLNRKLLGRVGDSSILGCGTYANQNTGCSLTGHGESIIKLGLSRAIVEDIEQDLSALEALKKNFALMSSQFQQTGGGIVLESNGRWGTYFTSDKMPYAVIDDGLIIFGAKLNERRAEIFYDAKQSKCTEKHMKESRLFSFREWQMYIECRKTILINSHFPTKLKHCPDAHIIDSIYLKFLDFINSKSDREALEITKNKHFLPENLSQALQTYMMSLDNTDDLNGGYLFPPSLTPLRSYLLHLINDPLNTLPRIVQRDFFHANVKYLTKSKDLKTLAAKCNVEVDIIDSNLHFLEKTVSPYLQEKARDSDQFMQLVDVEDDDIETDQTDNLNNYYALGKVPCDMRLNRSKKQYYDEIDKDTKDPNNFNLEGFTFTEVLPNGRLAIPVDRDLEDERKEKNLVGKLAELCEKYNLQLSNTEQESLLKQNMESRTNTILKKLHEKQRRLRDSQGRFYKEPKKKMETPSKENILKEKNYSNLNENVDMDMNKANLKNDKVENVQEEQLFTNLLNISNLDIDSSFDDAFCNTNNFVNLSQITLFDEVKGNISEKNKEHKLDGKVKFFRSFKDYWMYHCIFSRVRVKSFELFEKTLPKSFRWLLRECANIGEMHTSDLYEEVCLVESYFSLILKIIPSDINDDPVKSKLLSQIILSKW